VVVLEMTRPETFDDGGPVRLVHDAEKILTDGHASFHDWARELEQNHHRDEVLLHQE